MDIFSFIAIVILISLSGVLTPGPLFAATINEGRENKYAGFIISTGHAMVEIPLILLLLFLGFNLPTSLKPLISLIGGIVLLYMAYSEMKGSEVRVIRGFTSGIILSALNPYFLIWWLTIGFLLIVNSLDFGIFGFTIFIIVHELCDFSWLGFVSFTSNRIVKFPKTKIILKIVSITILTIFGIYFIYDALNTFLYSF